MLITRARNRRQKKQDASSDDLVRAAPLIDKKPSSSHDSTVPDLPAPTRRQNVYVPKDSGTFSANFGISSTGRLQDPSWYDPSSSCVASSVEKPNNIQEGDESEFESTEKTSLLSGKRDVSPEPATLGFGEMSATTGLWYRDVSGKQLTRFVVLQVFLIFSMFMVSTLCDTVDWETFAIKNF